MTTASLYLLPDISLEQCLQLSENNIGFAVWGTGVTINPEHLSRALEVLEVTGQVGEPEFEGVYPLVLKPKPRKAAVVGLPPAQHQAPPPVPEDPQRANYIRLCSSRIQEAIAAADQRLNLRLSKLEPVRAELFACRRQEFARALPDSEEERQELFSRQLQELAEVAKVEAVRVSRDCVLVYTDWLTAVHPTTGRQHLIGKFLIVIDLTGKGVSWFNQTRTATIDGKTWQAPGIETDRAGINEIDESLLQLIAGFELAVVAELAIQFVEIVEPGQAERLLAHWPAVAADKQTFDKTRTDLWANTPLPDTATDQNQQKSRQPRRRAPHRRAI